MRIETFEKVNLSQAQKFDKQAEIQPFSPSYLIK
jgi:hypothetical protein